MGSSSTATPLALTYKETPQSLTVLTRQRLDDQKLDNVMDALEATTGITAFRQGMGTDLSGLWSRGFNVSNFLVDGSPSAFGASNYVQSTALFDRVEVLRGASGLMSGVGSPAASINMVRKRPTAENQSSITVEAGNWQRYGAGADVSGPLNEAGNVRGRLVADYKDQKSWLDRYAKQSGLIYGIGEVDVDRDTRLGAGFSHQSENNDSPLRTGVPLRFADGTSTRFARSTNVAPDWSFFDTRLTHFFVNAEHDFGDGWQGRAELGHSRYQYDSALYFLTGSLDPSTGLGGVLWPVRWASVDRQNSLDARIKGPFTLGGRQHELVAGVTLSRTSRDTPDYGGWVGPWTGYDGAIGNPATWDGRADGPAFTKAGDTKSVETQNSAYLTTRLHLAEPTRLILGARMTDWKRTADATTVAGIRSSTKIKEDGVFVPFAGIVHDIDKQWSAYASYTRIFNPQSASIRDTDNNVLAPERGNSLEAGVKASLAQNRLDLGLAVFRTRQDNLATYSSTLGAYEALQGISTKGFEAEITGQIAPGWNVSAGYTYTASQDADGLRAVTQIPRNSVKLFTAYRLPGDWHRLTLGMGMNWQSRYGYVDEAQQGSYSVYSLLARYQVDRTLQVSLNVANVLDKRYYSGLGNYGGVYGSPRGAMLSAKYQF